MYNIFLISDTHFCHENIYHFTNYDGTKVRPWSHAREGDEVMVENWNKVVKPVDKVYHLGDVGFTNMWRNVVRRLNGEKCLIRGNHDKAKLNHYAELFYNIRGMHNLENFILTHAPIHPDSMARWRVNVHGHLHGNRIPDKRYINVSVECINYTPIAFEEVKKYFGE